MKKKTIVNVLKLVGVIVAIVIVGYFIYTGGNI